MIAQVCEISLLKDEFRIYKSTFFRTLHFAHTLIVYLTFEFILGFMFFHKPSRSKISIVFFFTAHRSSGW